MKTLKMKPDGKEYPQPTLNQSLEAWCLINDLVELGYPHNFQHEAPHIRSYMYKIGDIVEEAFRIKKKNEG